MAKNIGGDSGRIKSKARENIEAQRKRLLESRSKTHKWHWHTPAGFIESRPMTDAEVEAGGGCPEVPGIWDYPTKNNYSYCPLDGAALEHEYDSLGNLHLFCRVCWAYRG